MTYEYLVQQAEKLVELANQMRTTPLDELKEIEIPDVPGTGFQLPPNQLLGKTNYLLGVVEEFKKNGPVGKYNYQHLEDATKDVEELLNKI